MKKKYLKNLENLRNRIDKYKHISSDNITNILRLRQKIQKKRNYEI